LFIILLNIFVEKKEKSRREKKVFIRDVKCKNVRKGIVYSHLDSYIRA